MTIANNYIPKSQIKCIVEIGMESYMQQLREILKAIENCPNIYSTENEDISNVTAYLHFYSSEIDWYITELGSDITQEGFGVVINGNDPEIGYISIKELKNTSGVEIDLNWIPTKIRNINKLQTLVNRNQ